MTGARAITAAGLLLLSAAPVPGQTGSGPAAGDSRAATRPAGAVRGRCRSADGSPLAGARVQLVRFRDDSLPRPARRLDLLLSAEANTDAAGEFRLVAEPGRWYWLWADRDELRVERPMLRVVAGAYLDVAMAPGDVRTGRVLRAGKPVAGVPVTAFEMLQPERCGQALYRETVRTAEDGGFRLVVPAWLSPGVVATVNEEIAGAELRAAPVDLELAARPEQQLVVVNEQGAPIAGARIERHSAWRPPAVIAQTDADGRAKVPWSSALEILIARTADAVAARAVLPDVPGIGNAQAPRVTLSSGLRLRGRLLGPGRQPLTGRAVLAHSHEVIAIGDPSPECRNETTTDETGRFDLPAVRARVRTTLFVDHQGVWVPLTQLVPDKAELGDLEFLGPERLQVNVLDPQGTPLPAALVLIHRIPEPGFQAGAETVPSRVAFTDQAGRTVLDGLAPGSYRLLAAASGQPFVRATVTLRRGEPERKTMQMPKGGGVVAGRVVGPDGKPVPFVDLQLQPLEGVGGDQEFTLNTWTFLTGPDGRFRFSGLADSGQAWLMATATWHGVSLSGTHQTEPGQQEVEIRLQ